MSSFLIPDSGPRKPSESVQDCNAKDMIRKDLINELLSVN